MFAACVPIGCVRICFRIVADSDLTWTVLRTHAAMVFTGCVRKLKSSLVKCAIGRIERWHTDSQQCSEPRPHTTPVKATGGRQDYHNFEAPLMTMLLVVASQALTDCATKTFLFQYSKYTYFGGWCGRCSRCGVS